MSDISSAKIMLDQRLVYASMRMRREDFRASVDYDIDFDQLIFKVETYCLTERLVGDTYTVSGVYRFPASPWQHFKEKHEYAWWLRWLTKRWAVRFEYRNWGGDVHFTRYAQYPLAEVRPKALGRAVLFENIEEDMTVEKR